MLPLSPRICQCMRQFFVKRPTFLASTSNLRVEQNLVHLGRFLNFSQKVVGVTLKRIGRLSNYSLVIPSSFSSSIILKFLKFSPSFATDFVTREQQQIVHPALTDNLALMIIDNWSDPRATPRQFRWYKSRDPG